jgi:DNA-binding FadR family transcriptional regulator
MNFPFRAAKQNRIFHDVVDQVQEAIIEGRLKAGDMLPPERELKEMLKTSRGTLREALRVLEEKGLIEIKLGVGGGPIVKSLGTEQISESLALLIRYQKVSLNHLAEFREGVEGNVAALAAERAKKIDIKKLKELLVEAKNQLEKGVSHWDDFVRIDEQMHTVLAKTAENPIYKSLVKVIHDNIHRYYERFLPREEHVLRENYQDLCDIVRAVEQKRATEARSLAQHHVRRFLYYLKEGEAKK